MIEQKLFDDLPDAPEPTERQKRRDAAAACFKKQHAVWKKAVIEFAVNEWLPRRQGKPFLSEDLRTAYEKYAKFMGAPMATKGQAWAGIMLMLRKDKHIQTSVPMRRKNGVFATGYIVR